MYYRYEPQHRLMQILCDNKRPLCRHCGHGDERVLQFDHVYNDGKTDRKKHYSKFKLIMYYLSNPEIAKDRLQVLCCNCHFLKTWRRG